MNADAMRTLECGCEVSPTGKLMSLCTLHGEHAQAVQEVRRLPRNQPDADRDPELRAFERELTKVIAPIVIAAWSHVTDFESSAEATFKHVQAHIRRLE